MKAFPRTIPLLAMAIMLNLLGMPDAHAFPPCPKGMMQVPTPLGSEPPVAPRDAENLYVTQYTLTGNKTIINQLLLDDPSGHGSKCKDRIALASLPAQVSPGILTLRPAYPGAAGFGVVFLPDWPLYASGNPTVTYGFDFRVDNSGLSASGDWLDLVQLGFEPSDTSPAGWFSSLYRLRKVSDTKGILFLQLIESRSVTDVIGKVVATIPLLDDSGSTAFSLRWTQTSKSAKTGLHVVDAVIELYGPDGARVYANKLPFEWASQLSSGMLDYSIKNPDKMARDTALTLTNTELSAE